MTVAGVQPNVRELICLYGIELEGKKLCGCCKADKLYAVQYDADAWVLVCGRCDVAWQEREL